MIRSIAVWVFTKSGFYSLDACCSIDIGVQTVYIYSEEECMVRNNHGPDGGQEVIRVLKVAGVFGGEGVKKVVNVLGDMVGGAAAV